MWKTYSREILFRVKATVEDTEFAKQLVYCILYCTVGHCFPLFILPEVRAKITAMIWLLRCKPLHLGKGVLDLALCSRR